MTGNDMIEGIDHTKQLMVRPIHIYILSVCVYCNCILIKQIKLIKYNFEYQIIRLLFDTIFACLFGLLWY